MSGERKFRNLSELAWGVIANVDNGDWNLQSSDWRAAAEEWRDRYQAAITRRRRLYGIFGMLALVGCVSIPVCIGACGPATSTSVCSDAGALDIDSACSKIANAITDNPACAAAMEHGEEPACESILKSGSCSSATVWCADGIDAAVKAIAAAPTCEAVQQVTLATGCQ